MLGTAGDLQQGEAGAGLAEEGPGHGRYSAYTRSFLDEGRRWASTRQSTTRSARLLPPLMNGYYCDGTSLYSASE